MDADKVTFSHQELSTLSDDERCMFVQAAVVLNDLRFFDQQLLRHIQFLRDASRKRPHEMEISILFSQFTLLFGDLAGKLTEANNVIRKSYFAPKLSITYDVLLSDEAQSALKNIKKYFAKKDNLANKIRNNFAFHYDRDQIKEFLDDLPNDWSHSAFIAQPLNNSVLEFGQVCSMNAMFKVTGRSNPVEGLFYTYDDLSSKLLRDFVVFLHGFLEAAGERIHMAINRESLCEAQDAFTTTPEADIDEWIAGGAKRDSAWRRLNNVEKELFRREINESGLWCHKAITQISDAYWNRNVIAERT